jgi:hypothetical protein
LEALPPVIEQEEGEPILAALHDADLKTIADVLRLDSYEVSQLPGMGSGRTAILRGLLRRQGLSLKAVSPAKAGARAASQLPPLTDAEARSAVAHHQRVTGRLVQPVIEHPWHNPEVRA